MVQIIWVLWEFHCICDLPFSQWLENFLPWTNNHFLAVPDLNPVTPSVYGFCPLDQQLFSVKVYQSCQCLFLVVNFRKIGPETWKISMFHIMFLFIYQVMIFFLWDVKGAREHWKMIILWRMSDASQQFRSYAYLSVTIVNVVNVLNL